MRRCFMDAWSFALAVCADEGRLLGPVKLNGDGSAVGMRGALAAAMESDSRLASPLLSVCGIGVG